MSVFRLAAPQRPELATNPEPVKGERTVRPAEPRGQGGNILQHGTTARQLRQIVRGNETKPGTPAGPQPGERQRHALRRR